MSNEFGRRVLVTGAAGFLGRHVARHFAMQGFEVTGLGRGELSVHDAAAWGMRSWHRADIDRDSLAAHAGQPDVVVHCAGAGAVGASFQDPAADFERTVATTAALLEFIRLRAPAARLVYPSSAAVYGVAERIPIAEDDRLMPVSPYGTHKLIAETLCGSYARHFGVHIAIVRFFSIYGPHLRKQLLWDACNKLGAGQTSFAGTGAEIRDWLHVDDAVRLLYVAARQASPACPIVNGATGTGVAIRDMLDALSAALGRGKSVTFSGAARSGDPQAYVADMSAAKRWGFEPSIGWRAGVESYVAWYRSRDAAS